MNLLEEAGETAVATTAQVVGAFMAASSGQATPVLTSLDDHSILKALQRGQMVAFVVSNTAVQPYTGPLRLQLPVRGVNFNDANGNAIASQVGQEREVVVEGHLLTHSILYFRWSTPSCMGRICRMAWVSALTTSTLST